MNYPENAKIDNELYPINTDFKVAIRCLKVIDDESISDLERGMAIVFLLFGEKGLKSNKKEQLLKKAEYFLQCGKEVKETNEKPDMDFVEDYPYIKASFRSDYNGMNIDKEHIHWWEFNELMNGLSNSEMGNCCILNRIRNLRTFDLKDINDPKERQKIRKAQEEVALKKYKPKKIKPTEEQKASARRFYESLKE